MSLFPTKYYSLIQDISGSTYQVNLRSSGFTGSMSGITHYQLNPLTISYSGGKEDADDSIFGSTASFTFYVDETIGQNFDEILTSNFNTWQLEISGGTSNPVYWLGYIKPENTTRSFILPKYYLTIQGTDGLGDLSNIPYQIYSNQSTQFISVAQAIQNCLQLTGLKLPVRSQVNILESHISGATGSTEILSNLYVRNDNFFKTSTTGTTFLDCYTAVQNLLEPFNAILIQSDGYFTITQKNESNSFYNFYKTVPTGTLAGLITGSTKTAFDRTVTATTFVVGSDQLEYIAPTKQYQFTFQDHMMTGTTASFITNSTFPPSQNIQTWSQSGSTAFNSMTWGGTGNPVMELDETISPNVSKKVYTFFNAVSDGNTGNTLTIQTDVNLFLVTFNSGSALPAVKFRLIAPNGSDLTVFENPQNISSSGSFHTFKNTATVMFTQSGTYRLEIQLIPNAGSNYQGVHYYVDNVYVYPTFKNKNATTPVFNYGFTNNGLATVDKGDLLFSDSLYSNDKGVILAFRDNAKPTVKWLNYASPVPNFGNNSFDGGSLLPWTQSNINFGVSGWQYFGGISNDIQINAGTNMSFMVQQGPIRPGTYSFTFQVKNNSSIVGVNPNLFLTIYQIDADGTIIQRGQTTLTSDGSFHTVTFSNITFSKHANFGFQLSRFGPGSDLTVTVSQVDITSAATFDRNRPHYQWYLYSKIRKNLKFKKYVSVTAKSNKIRFNNLVNINDTVYEITSYTYDIQGCNVELQLSEFLDQYVDQIAPTFLQIPLPNS